MIISKRGLLRSCATSVAFAAFNLTSACQSTTQPVVQTGDVKKAKTSEQLYLIDSLKQDLGRGNIFPVNQQMGNVRAMDFIRLNLLSEGSPGKFLIDEETILAIKRQLCFAVQSSTRLSNGVKDGFTNPDEIRIGSSIIGFLEVKGANGSSVLVFKSSIATGQMGMNPFVSPFKTSP